MIDPALQLAIGRLSLVYAAAVDRRQYHQLRDVFVEDAVLRGEHFSYHGIEDILEGMRIIEHFERTFHAVHNQLITVDGSQAQGEVYCVASHLYRADEAAGQPPGLRKLDWGLRYLDEYRDVHGQWRIARRELIVDWTSDSPAGS